MEPVEEAFRRSSVYRLSLVKLRCKSCRGGISLHNSDVDSLGS